MPSPRPIQKLKQLLVEGKDQQNFFEAFLDHIHDRNVQVQDFGGVQELRRFLLAFVNMPEFGTVESVGIVRDAEDDANGAWQSVRSALENVKMPVPEHAGQRNVGKPGVSVFILPGDNQPGMLETLLNQSFAGEPVNGCIIRSFSASRICRTSGLSDPIRHARTPILSPGQNPMFRSAWRR